MQSDLPGFPSKTSATATSLCPAQAHDYALDLPEVLRHGDVLIVAVGRPELVRGSWVKPGAVVIDVGINVVEVSSRPARFPLASQLNADLSLRTTVSPSHCAQ